MDQPHGTAYSGKRALDLVIAVSAFAVLWPVMFIAAIGVRLTSPGPVLFRARRVGRFGREFDAWKFRSMYIGMQGPAVTAANDVRVTPIGRLLRKTKIDELPQFFNVIRGEMSVVGPRPEDPRYVAGYTHDQARILQWCPGLTSPASLEFRHEESILEASDDLASAYDEIMNRKIDIDIDYLKSATALDDLRVIAGTFRAIVTRRPLEDTGPESHSTANVGS